MIAMLFLDQIFERFCDYIEGRLRWNDSDDQWTESVFGFFSKENAAQVVPYVEIIEHMLVDYIWRYDPQKYPMNDIELAVESENQENRVDELIGHEIQHLADIKAHYKIAILYPTLGDEAELLDKISKTIKNVSERYRIEEEYLAILGYSTTTAGKRAILWKGIFFDKNGNLKVRKEKRTMQRDEGTESINTP